MVCVLSEFFFSSPFLDLGGDMMCGWKLLYKEPIFLWHLSCLLRQKEKFSIGFINDWAPFEVRRSTIFVALANPCPLDNNTVQKNEHLSPRVEAPYWTQKHTAKAREDWNRCWILSNLIKMTTFCVLKLWIMKFQKKTCESPLELRKTPFFYGAAP